MRIAYFLTHPIQYQSPLIRHLRAGGIDVHVIYGNDATSRKFFDQGFGKELAWDVPLLEGYPSNVLNTEEPRGSHSTQRAHFRRQIAALLETESFDVAWLHGWAHPFTQAAWGQARTRRLPIWLRGETFAGCIRGGPLRRLAHRLIFRRKFQDVSAFLAVGTRNAELYRQYGVDEGRIVRAPYVVDNTFFQARCREVSPRRDSLRAELGIAPEHPILLFCGKLIGVKAPEVLIQAVGAMNSLAHCLVVGDGELRPSLEELAAEVAPKRVTFLGFRNQSELPAFYDLCDVFVLPSRFEPWGLVVNEVMNAGRTVVVSDQAGCAPDLVKEGVNGSIFRSGDVTSLARILDGWCVDAAARQNAGRKSLEIISEWGFDQVLEGVQKLSRQFLKTRS